MEPRVGIRVKKSSRKFLNELAAKLELRGAGFVVDLLVEKLINGKIKLEK